MRYNRNAIRKETKKIEGHVKATILLIIAWISYVVFLTLNMKGL